MRKVVKWLYPPHDKVSVFLMAVILLAVFVLNGVLREVYAEAFGAWYEQEPVKAVSSAIIFTVCICAALCLPFTRSDLRGWATAIVVVHALVLIAANFKLALDSPAGWVAALSWGFVVYSALWLVVMRYGRQDDIVSAGPAHPRTALCSGVLCVALLFVALNVLETGWLTAYSFAIVTASGINLAVGKLLSGGLPPVTS